VPADQLQAHSSVSSDPAIDPGAGTRIEGRLLRADPVGLVLPAGCACCGAPASGSRTETRAEDEASLIVPYCSQCHRHASAASTRMLSVTLASCLLGATLAGVLPLLWDSVGPVQLCAVALAGAALPVLLGLLWRARVAVGHTSSGRAVWWCESGELACTNPRWAAELASANGLVARRALLRPRTFSGWILSGLVVTLVATPFFYWLHRPLVRIINLTPARITVLVDGRAVASVEPTSAESPSAGVEVHVPSGPRRLVAESSDGRHVSEDLVAVRAGRQHLYAPGSGGYCFWLETVGYGRTRPARPELQPLLGQSRFWVLPNVDAWFAPAPQPSERDDRSSGGVLTALRQARCQQAPPAVEQAAAHE
jgi:hypothetical protein